MQERFFIYKDRVVRIVKCYDGLWRDDIDGCIYALAEDTASVDANTVCGIGPFSLPHDSPLNAACAAHDFAYSCPVYQLYHTREEADKMLKEHLKLTAEGTWYSFVTYPFYCISRLFGGLFWENKKTKN